MVPIAVAAFAVLLAAAACGGSSAEVDAEPDGASPRLLATTTVLGEVTANAVCDAATVETLMSPGQDPHAFELSARQAAELRDADLVIANGLELEQGFTDVLLEARDSGTPVLFVAEEVNPILHGGAGGHGEDEAHEHGALDPHVWMDPLRMADGARLIGAELARVANDDEHAVCAETYAATLEALDREVSELLDAVPESSRKLVTNHDSLGYFADRYGFELVGVLIPSGSTLAESSASDIVELVEAIDREGVSTIFVETISSTRLAEAVADETGEEVEVVPLYTGSLGEEGSGAETYAGMIATNAERIRAALTR